MVEVYQLEDPQTCYIPIPLINSWLGKEEQDGYVPPKLSIWGDEEELATTEGGSKIYRKKKEPRSDPIKNSAFFKLPLQKNSLTLVFSLSGISNR